MTSQRHFRLLKANVGPQIRPSPHKRNHVAALCPTDPPHKLPHSAAARIAGGQNHTYGSRLHLWGRAQLMGQGPTYGAELHLWVWTPLMGRSPTYGAELHLWVTAHLWVRAPLMGHSSTYGSEPHL